MTLDQARKLIIRGINSSNVDSFMRLYEAMLRVNGWVDAEPRHTEVARVRGNLTGGR